MIIKSIPDSLAPANPPPEVPASFLPPGGAWPARRALRASIDKVIQAGQDITLCSADLGIDPTDLSDTTDTALLIVDPKSPWKSRILSRILPGVPQVVIERSGVTAEQITDPLSKFGPMVSFFASAVDAQTAFSDSGLVVGALMVQEFEDILQKMTAVLPEGVPLTDDQRQAKRVWQPVAKMLQQLAQAITDKLDAGKKGTQTRLGELATAGNYVDLLQTMVDLKSGQQVDDARAAQAVATFQAEQAAAQKDDLAPLMPAAKPAKGRRTKR